MLQSFSHLQRWGIECLDGCFLCSLEDETTEHIFINCNYSRALWEAFLARTGYVLWEMIVIRLLVADIYIGHLIKGSHITLHFGASIGLR